MSRDAAWRGLQTTCQAKFINSRKDAEAKRKILVSRRLYVRFYDNFDCGVFFWLKGQQITHGKSDHHGKTGNYSRKFLCKKGQSIYLSTVNCMLIHYFLQKYSQIVLWAASSNCFCFLIVPLQLLSDQHLLIGAITPIKPGTPRSKPFAALIKRSNSDR